MVKAFSFYPYRLEKLTKDASTQNTNGNFVTSSGSYEFVCLCRDKKSVANNTIVIDEGKRTKTRTISIYCPFGTVALTPGTIVRVVDENGTIRSSGEIVESESNRLHTVQWL